MRLEEIQEEKHTDCEEKKSERCQIRAGVEIE